MSDESDKLKKNTIFEQVQQEVQKDMKEFMKQQKVKHDLDLKKAREKKKEEER